MVKRLLAGSFKGLLVGIAAAAVLAYGLGITMFGGPLLAYLGAAVVGLLCALVAGRPVWVRGALVESALKGVVAAALAAGATFLLRRYGMAAVELPAGLGAGALADLPILVLPLLAVPLATFFEADHSPSETVPPEPRARVDTFGLDAHVERDAEELEAPDEEVPRPTTRRRR